MHWIAPSEKDTNSAALEKRLWDAAKQAVPAPRFAETDFNGGRPRGLLGLNFLRFVEIRFAAKRAQLESPSPLGGERAGVRGDAYPRPSDGSPRPSDGRGVRGEGGGEWRGGGDEAYSGDPSKELSIHGVEKTDETGRLCRLNLAA